MPGNSEVKEGQIGWGIKHAKVERVMEGYILIPDATGEVIRKPDDNSLFFSVEDFPTLESMILFLVNQVVYHAAILRVFENRTEVATAVEETREKALKV